MGNCLGVEQKRLRFYKYLYENSKTPLVIKDACLRRIARKQHEYATRRLTATQNRLRTVTREKSELSVEKAGLLNAEVVFLRAIKRMNPSGWKQQFESRVKTHIEPVVLPTLISIEHRLAAKTKEETRLRKTENGYQRQINGINEILSRVNEENDTVDAEWLFKTVNTEFTVSSNTEGPEQARFQASLRESEDEDAAGTDKNAEEKALLNSFIKAIMESGERPSTAYADATGEGEDDDMIISANVPLISNRF